MTATSTTPPIHSARVNCQSSNRKRMIPSSITRLVDENRKASEGTRAAPRLNSVRDTAAEAQEQLELAAPKAVAGANS